MNVTKRNRIQPSCYGGPHIRPFYDEFKQSTLVEESQRRQFQSRAIKLEMAESAARLRDARVITLETTSFQAVDFYPKFGYEVIAQIEDLPAGQNLYYMKKVLEGPGSDR